MERYVCPHCKQNYLAESEFEAHLMDAHAYSKEKAVAESTEQKYHG